MRLGAIDEITLDLSGTLIEQLGSDSAAAAALDVADDDEEQASAGPLTIAVDVNEASPPADVDAGAAP